MMEREMDIKLLENKVGLHLFGLQEKTHDIY